MDTLEQIEALSDARKIIERLAIENTDQPMPVRVIRWDAMNHIDKRVGELLKEEAL